MKYFSFLLFIVVLIVVAGCKKDDNEFIEKLENVYLKEEVVRSLTGDVIYQMKYNYDASGRFLGGNNFKYEYNEDGNLTFANLGGERMNIFYGPMGRISRINFHGNVWIDLELHYGAGSKPEYAVLNRVHLIKYKYSEDGHIVSKEHFKLYDGTYLHTEKLTWSNGNLMMYENKVLNMLYKSIYTYDSKPSYAKAKHLPKEYLLAAELLGLYNMNHIMEITENNVTRMSLDTYIHEYTILQYSTETGLPLRVKSESVSTDYVYGTR